MWLKKFKLCSFKFILVCGGGDLWRIYSYIYFSTWTAVAQLLRCCATNGEVAGLIPNVVIGIFQLHKSFRSHYDPGVVSVSNKNEYQDDFQGVKAAGT